MREEDTVTLRQFLAAVFVSLFSPVSRLIPRAVLEIAGTQGWIAPALAWLPAAGLVLLMRGLLERDGERLGLARALRLDLGEKPGRAVTLLLVLWLVLYGGFVLRSGAERLISTVYPSADLSFFAFAVIGVCTLSAAGKLRYAFRSAAVILLLFSFILLLIVAFALPNVRGAYLRPLFPADPGKVLLSVLPAADVLTPWMPFTFLWGRVEKQGNPLKPCLRGLAVTAAGVLLLMLTTVGILGEELSLRQQYPFFIMIKNLSVFHVVERIEPLVVTVWLMTDYVCITACLLSASEGCRSMFPGKRSVWAAGCGGAMLAACYLLAPDAFFLEKLSNTVVPAVNLSLCFLLMPAVRLIGLWKNHEKIKKRLDKL
jgi:spore germination protein KB